MGKRGNDQGGPQKPNARVDRVMNKTITFEDSDDDGQLPEAPAMGAVSKSHMAEGASGFTYGGGGYRGSGQEQSFSFVKMDEDDPVDNDESQEDRMAAKHKANSGARVPATQPY